MVMESRYYNAIVKKFVPNGVRLDLGVDKPGYLHVSKMKPKGEFVSNASEVLSLKDVIPVRMWKIKTNELEARVQKDANGHITTKVSMNRSYQYYQWISMEYHV